MEPKTENDSGAVESKTLQGAEVMEGGYVSPEILEAMSGAQVEMGKHIIVEETVYPEE